MAGRPRLFNTEEEMQAIIDKYFAECEVKDKPLTISGLALALGMDRRSLLNYEKREEFFPTIKAAKQKVEEYIEICLMTKSATGAIFNLKNNFGWEDTNKIENQQLGKDGEPIDPAENLLTWLASQQSIDKKTGN